MTEKQSIRDVPFWGAGIVDPDMFGTKFIRIRKSPWGKLSGFDVEKPWF
jgi:hypothetical protein